MIKLWINMFLFILAMSGCNQEDNPKGGQNKATWQIGEQMGEGEKLGPDQKRYSETVCNSLQIKAENLADWEDNLIFVKKISYLDCDNRLTPASNMAFKLAQGQFIPKYALTYYHREIQTSAQGLFREFCLQKENDTIDEGSRRFAFHFTPGRENTMQVLVAVGKSQGSNFVVYKKHSLEIYADSLSPLNGKVNQHQLQSSCIQDPRKSSLLSSQLEDVIQ